MTFSIVGFCERTESVGIAISSSSIAVTSRCAWIRNKAGVIATQNLTNPHLGPIGLDLLHKGLTSQLVCDALLAVDKKHHFRQILVLDRTGKCVAYTGNKSLQYHSHFTGEACGAAGNLLKNPKTPELMVKEFLNGYQEELPQRLMNAMFVGLKSGGEIRELQSAGLMVTSGDGWVSTNLRIDYSENPLTELQHLLSHYKPLEKGYLERVDYPENYQSS